MEKTYNSANSTDVSGTTSNQITQSFHKSVIDAFSIRINGQTLNYEKYLALPPQDRSNDEADAVDERFARYILNWLGFTNEDDWNYNRPQSGKKTNRPDFSVHASVGKAFIWEDKNSVSDLEEKHLKQMRRYSVDTAGYAVWCNMRRILAVRFLSSEKLGYEILADIHVENMFGPQRSFNEHQQIDEENLALFRLLFCKERFTKFAELTAKIAVEEDIFKRNSTLLVSNEAKHSFIDSSRQSLEHLKLAALTQVRKFLAYNDSFDDEEEALHQEWKHELNELANKIAFDNISKPVLEDIDKYLTPYLGKFSTKEIDRVKSVIENASGIKKLTPSLNAAFDTWRERATKINTAFQIKRFQISEASRIIEAYRIWRERQSEQKENDQETFAEQVAYVFFIRLFLIRVLEDKEIIKPRLASDGGFSDWKKYIKTHFKELDGISILDQSYCSILTQKAEHYYLHFYQQPIFDWFIPDDFLFVETLEFLCRYNFHEVASDIIGFTYEEYIQKIARKPRGHFLTRDEVVEYMLDLIDYKKTSIIGRRVLDPACGSGSFLVHAAKRYRNALITALCNQYNVSEEGLYANSTYRRELAQRYLEDLTSLFFGMELNPFACYLAEMNMLIQALDDLFILQQSGEVHPIERFQIYNTDSLDLPREVLKTDGLLNSTSTLWIPNLSDSLSDESYLLKARLDSYSQGFFFILSNPPYINAARVRMDKNYASYPFFNQILSSITNTYLLFLRLGMYYLSEGGRMIFIVPLTIIGDISANNARIALNTSPFKITKITRFFTGNVLFPGVDQTVAILQAEKEVVINPNVEETSNSQVEISGGYTISEAIKNKTFQSTSLVFHKKSASDKQSAWLVSNDTDSYKVWEHVRSISNSDLGSLWNTHLEIRKGDVASDHLNPFRLGRNHKSAPGDIAVQKGEDVFRYAPLSKEPSDWVRPKEEGEIRHSQDKSVNKTLLRIGQLETPEQGITLRKIARLNTRETLIATWFQRDKNTLFLFPDEHWRFRLLPYGDLKVAQGLLALLNSRVTAYLLNLFSTNNNVSQNELSHISIPDPRAFPVTQLATLTENLLDKRAFIENEFIMKYGADFPEVDTNSLYLPPSRFLLANQQMQKMDLDRWAMQGLVINRGNSSGRVKALRKRNLIEYKGEDSSQQEVLSLFLDELSKKDLLWSDAQKQPLPDIIIASPWLRMYKDTHQRAQMSWGEFISLQEQVDNVVMDWYRFDDTMRKAIVKGLDWVQRRRAEDISTDENNSEVHNHKIGLARNSTLSGKSSFIYDTRYNNATQALEIEFNEGDIWCYEGIPQIVYEELSEADSPGNYYTKKIKGKYPSRKLSG